MKKKKLAIFVILIIALLLILGFGGSYYYKTIYTKTRFERFLDESFQYIASENALTLHMNLQHPEDYGIDENQIALLPDLSEKTSRQQLAYFESMLQQLHQFSMENLQQDYQFLALLLEYNLKEYITMEKEFPYYKTNLGKNGSLADLSILFSEFTLENREDLALYEKLLGKLPAYLDSMVAYECRRQKAGIRPSISLIEGTLEHIDSLLESPDSNIYLESFENRINKASFLNSSEKRNFSLKNETLIQKLVLPAYEKARTDIKEKLKPVEENQGLASYPNGKKYYGQLLTSEVGSSLNPQDCRRILSKDIAKQQKILADLYKENPEIELDYLTAFPAIQQPEEILNDLKNVTRIEFPAIDDISCDISEISDSVESATTTAFYVTPPLDYTGKNHIFLQDYNSMNLKLYATIAHEGYPGHMYQTNYFYQNMIHPIQLYLKMPGYNEGWGTYAEYYSYDFLSFQDMDETLTDQVKTYIRANSLLHLNLSCMADLLVNDLGYDKAHLAQYMEEEKMNPAYADQVYDYVCENPCTYLNYGIGYYEFQKLLEEEKKKADFSMLSFHTKILSYGSCPFSLLDTMLKQEGESLSFVDYNE